MSHYLNKKNIIIIVVVCLLAVAVCSAAALMLSGGRDYDEVTVSGQDLRRRRFQEIWMYPARKAGRYRKTRRK